MGKRFYNRISRIFNCKHGGGLVDKLISTLLLEALIPRYNFCGQKPLDIMSAIKVARKLIH